MHAEDFAANEQAEKEEDEGLYTQAQAQAFCQQSIALQRLQFAHSATVASVSSMSLATTPPLPPQSPPQTAAILTNVLSKQQRQQQQQQQHQQSPIKKSSTATAQSLISAAVVTAYQQQQQQQQQIPQRQHAHHTQQQQHQQQSLAEQMISATDVSASAAAAYKRQQQKLRKLRELHSLALEGGDTARGYCSCDEQWTSSSPPTSGSPTLSCNEGHEKTSDGSEANETAATTAAIKTERVTGSAYKQMNVTTGHDRSAIDGNDAGHSRTWQLPNRSSSSNSNSNNTNSTDGLGHIWSGTRANEVAKAAAAVVAAKAAASATATPTTATSMTAGALRPVPAVRLKQQHHVRFSDEKNFSD